MRQMTGHLKETPSQTAGPYVHIGCTPNFLGLSGVYPQDMGVAPIRDGVEGTRITITGQILDGAGAPIRDAVIETWQADAAGRYNSPLDPRSGADPQCSGWARLPIAFDTAMYVLHTVKPGRVPFPDGRLQAPHISLWIVARGINVGLNTRLYFADEDEANAEDPVLQRIEHVARRRTLMAVRTQDGYRFDIHLQGDAETVFFDV